ncbi:hypothetical protein GGQ95_000241 [Anoxybacillus rupiensis]|nr:hypothetical protein [Anoxybacillus rupiensis]
MKSLLVILAAFEAAQAKKVVPLTLERVKQ